MQWSEQAWVQIEPCYQAIIQMPFITELTDGTLPLEKFRFYMAQDSLYLEHFGRALSVVAARADQLQDSLSFIRFAEGAIVVEQMLHDSYFKEFGLMDRGLMQPACHHYVHFLKSTVCLDAVEIGMAALLPCFWIYKRVGDFILNSRQIAGNPYQKWIDTYAGEDFGIAVQKAIDICNSAAANTTDAIRQKMTDAFISSSRLEFEFWQAAYDNKTWSI